MPTDRIIARYKLSVEEQEREAVAPPEWEETVKKMKKHPEIDNPWALAWHMKNKGYEPHTASDPRVFLAALRDITHDTIVDLNFTVMDPSWEAKKALATLPRRIAKLESVLRETFEGTPEEKKQAIKAARALELAGRNAEAIIVQMEKAYDDLNTILDAAGKGRPATWNDVMRSAAGPRMPDGLVHDVAAFAGKAKLRSAATDKTYELLKSETKRVQDANPVAKKKFDAAYDKLFDLGQEAANAGRQLMEKAVKYTNYFAEGEPATDALTLLNDAVIAWDRNRADHLGVKTRFEHHMGLQAEQSWAYAMKINTQIVMLDRAVKGEF